MFKVSTLIEVERYEYIEIKNNSVLVAYVNSLFFLKQFPAIPLSFLY
jgi:hypothetical protein